MSVLIVVESHFGNTIAVARAIASGVGEGGGEATVLTCGEAPGTIPDGVGLVLAGAPTHNLHLPTPASRSQAIEKGATEGATEGLQEWIARVTPQPELPVITFDTSMGTAFAGSAAKSAQKQLRRRGFRMAERGPSFVVGGTTGPLKAGELARAQRWGSELVSGIAR